MDEIIEIENYIDHEYVRHLHLISNLETFMVNLPVGVEPKITREAGVYHLRASWKAKDAFAGTMRGEDRRERQIVLWHIDGRLSECAREAAREFMRVFCRAPIYAAVWKIPRVADLPGGDIDIPLGDGFEPLALVESAEVPEWFVMVY